MNTFSSELQQWATEVIEKITPIAEQINLAYYPLQTEAKMNPELLIIGLNPRGDVNIKEDKGTYSNQKKSSDWEFKDEKMTVECLLKGNPCKWENEKWNVYQRLKGIGYIKNIIEKGNYCFINYIFFHTKDEKDLKALPKFKEVEDTCVSLTKKFVEIVNPKQIIVLGVTASDKLVSNKNTLLHRRSKLIIEGLISNRKVYCVCHPSRLSSYLNRNIINKRLGELLEGKNITPINLDNTINIQNILTALSKEGFNFIKLSGGEYYQLITQGIEGDELDLRIDLQDKIPYIAFRSSNQKDFLNLNAKDFYLKHFPNAESTEHWVGRKNLYVYSENTEQEVIDDLLSLLKAINTNQ